MTKRFSIAVGIAFAILVLDQLSKCLVREHIHLQEHIPQDSFISLTFSQNKGVSFSMLQDAGWVLTAIITIFVIIILIVIIGLIVRGTDFYAALCLVGIFAGGVGNLIDRYMFGWVTDFISVGSFPIFNIADSALVCSCVILILRLIFTQANPASSDTPAASDAPAASDTKDASKS